jgi:stalled ribosome alternative rescue factor ArfA
MTKEKIVDALIMAALFRATVEKSNSFNEDFKFKPKQEFKSFQNLGYKVIKNIGIEDEAITTALTEGIENVVHEFRKQLLNEITL